MMKKKMMISIYKRLENLSKLKVNKVPERSLLKRHLKNPLMTQNFQPRNLLENNLKKIKKPKNLVVMPNPKKKKKLQRKKLIKKKRRERMMMRKRSTRKRLMRRTRTRKRMIRLKKERRKMTIQ